MKLPKGMTIYTRGKRFKGSIPEAFVTDKIKAKVEAPAPAKVEKKSKK